MPEDYDSYDPEDSLLPTALEPPWKKVLKTVGVVIGLGALVGYGVWIGTIQANISSLKNLKSDIEETNKSFLALDHRITDRMDRFRDSFDLKDERNRSDISDLKEALFAFSTEMRYRHNTEPPIKPFKVEELPPGIDPNPIPGMQVSSIGTGHKLFNVKIHPPSHIAPPITTPSHRQATRKEINEAAKIADKAIQKALIEEEDNGLFIYAR
jgi:hypothetical protein